MPSNTSKPEQTKTSTGEQTAKVKVQSKPRVPAIFEYSFTLIICALLSGYTGARFVLLLKGSQAWTIKWIAALAAAALCVAFGGGTMNTILMQRSPRRFGWQDPAGVVQALCGGIASLWLTQSCGRGKSLDFFAWSGIECEQTFFIADCLNLTLLTAWSVSISWRDTLSHSNTVRAMRALVTTFLFVCGGGVIRDCVAIALGYDTTIGNFTAGVVVPVTVSCIIYHILVTTTPARLQLAVGLPLNFIIYYGLPQLF